MVNAILLASMSAVFHINSEHDAQTGTAQLFESCHPYENKIKKLLHQLYMTTLFAYAYVHTQYYVE